MQKKTQRHGITMTKRSQKVDEKSKWTIYLCTQLFDTLARPISEYGIWALKVSKSWKTNIHVHLYKFISSVKQLTAENFVYGELG